MHYRSIMVAFLKSLISAQHRVRLASRLAAAKPLAWFFQVVHCLTALKFNIASVICDPLDYFNP